MSQGSEDNELKPSIWAGRQRHVNFAAVATKMVDMSSEDMAAKK